MLLGDRQLSFLHEYVLAQYDAAQDPGNASFWIGYREQVDEGDDPWTIFSGDANDLECVVLTTNGTHVVQETKECHEEAYWVCQAG